MPPGKAVTFHPNPPTREHLVICEGKHLGTPHSFITDEESAGVRNFDVDTAMVWIRSRSQFHICICFRMTCSHV